MEAVEAVAATEKALMATVYFILAVVGLLFGWW